MLWDIFCKVIDNHGDIGVCWRLCAQLARRGEQVRLHVDDASALAWMAPGGLAGVEVHAWNDAQQGFVPGDVVVEAFGCELDEPVQAALAARRPTPAWINLEYLTAEDFAVRTHGLPSPVLAGPAAGLTKHFFYPGFVAASGGLLREDGLEHAQAAFDRVEWLAGHGVSVAPGRRAMSLFCYEPPGLEDLLLHLARDAQGTHLLVTEGRAARAVRSAIARFDEQRAGWNADVRLSTQFLPLLTQTDFDRLLWSCDLNFVRGEDSLVRALWAGRPFVWNIYPQHDDAHHAKLAAFLDWLHAPESLRAFHFAWNGVGGRLEAPAPQTWALCVRDARSALLAQDDLATRLVRFVAGRQA